MNIFRRGRADWIICKEEEVVKCHYDDECTCSTNVDLHFRIFLHLSDFAGHHHHSDIFNTFTFSNPEISASNINILLNISCYLHMCYNTLQKPSHICRQTSFHIPNIPETLCCITEHLPAQKHTYAKY